MIYTDTMTFSQAELLILDTTSNRIMGRMFSSAAERQGQVAEQVVSLTEDENIEDAGLILLPASNEFPDTIMAMGVVSFTSGFDLGFY